MISSVLGKKLAVGCQNVVVDLKSGPESKFWRTCDSWATGFSRDRDAAARFIAIGQLLGLNVSVVISNNYAPQGSGVGNSLALEEALRVLRGEGLDTDCAGLSPGLREQTALCLRLAGEALALTSACMSTRQGIDVARGAIVSGKALDVFARQLTAHNARTDWLPAPSELPHYQPPVLSECVVADTTGVVAGIDTTISARVARALISNGQRVVRHGCGFVLNVAVGAHVQTGEALATLYREDGASANDASCQLRGAFRLDDRVRPWFPPLVLARYGNNPQVQEEYASMRRIADGTDGLFSRSPNAPD